MTVTHTTLNSSSSVVTHKVVTTVTDEISGLIHTKGAKTVYVMGSATTMYHANINASTGELEAHDGSGTYNALQMNMLIAGSTSGDVLQSKSNATGVIPKNYMPLAIQIQCNKTDGGTTYVIVEF